MSTGEIIGICLIPIYGLCVLWVGRMIGRQDERIKARENVKREISELRAYRHED